MFDGFISDILFIIESEHNLALTFCYVLGICTCCDSPNIHLEQFTRSSTKNCYSGEMAACYQAFAPCNVFSSFIAMHFRQKSS